MWSDKSSYTQREKIRKQANKEDKNIWKFIKGRFINSKLYSDNTGDALYHTISDYFYTNIPKELYDELNKYAFNEADKEASLFLLRAGIDGIKYETGETRGKEGAKDYNYVVFDESAVTIEDVERYSTRKREEGAEDEGQTLEGFEKMMDEVEVQDLLQEWDKKHGGEPLTEEDKLRFSARLTEPGITEYNLLNNPERYDEKMRRWIQDEWYRVGKMVKEVEKIKGLEEGALPEDMDPLLALRMYSDAANGQVDALIKQIYSGKKSLTEKMVKAKTDTATLGTYTHARHAESRNDVIEMRDGIENGSAMETDYAKNMVKELENENPEIIQFGKWADEFGAGTLKLRYDGGLYTQEEYKQYSTQWEHYVPLKDAPEKKSWFRTANKLSVPLKIDYRAGGRSHLPTANPFIQLIVERIKTIHLVEVNKVGNALYSFDLEFPSGLFRFESDKQPMPSEKDLNEYGEQDYPIPQKTKGEEALTFRVSPENEGKFNLPRGTIVRTYIKDEGLKNTFLSLGEEKFRFWRWYQNVMDYLRKSRTVWSIYFAGLTNPMKDEQTIGLIVAGEHGFKNAFKQAINAAKAINGVWRYVRDNKPNEYSKLYEELNKMGGFTGYFNIRNLEDASKQFEKYVALYGDNKISAGKMFRYVMNIIQDVGKSFESGLRLSAAKTLLDTTSMPKKRVALYGRSVSVDFSTKGKYSHILSNYKMFSNPAIQMPFRVGRALKKYPRMRRIVAAHIVLSAAANALSHFLDPDDYEKMGAYGRDHYLLFPIPYQGKWVLYPAVYTGYANIIFHTLGNTTAEYFRGEINAKDVVQRMVSAFADAMLPFSGGTPLQALGPTVSEPFIQWAQNINWAGNPIHKPQNPFGALKPEHTMAFSTVNPLSKAFTIWLNEFGGGSEERGTAGVWPTDINPEMIDHFINWTVGSAGQVAVDMFTTGTTLVKGDLPENIDTVPFLNKVLKSPSEWADRGEVYEMIKASRKTVYSEKDTQKFSKVLNRAVSDGNIETDEAKRLRTEFRNNQREAKGLPKLQQGRPGPPSPPRPPRPPSYRNQ